MTDDRFIAVIVLAIVGSIAAIIIVAIIVGGAHGQERFQTAVEAGLQQCPRVGDEGWVWQHTCLVKVTP